MFPKSMDTPRLIGIAGASGSGKSFVADRIVEKTKDACLCLRIDNFYRDQSHLSREEKASKNYDIPTAIDWATLLTAINALQRSTSANVPVYDFTRHTRNSRYIRQDPAPVILLEGLWVFHFPEIKQLFSTTIYVDCPSRVRLERRISRDAKNRGRSENSIRNQFEKQVLPAEESWVLPQKGAADFVVESPVSEEQLCEIMKHINQPTH